MRPSDRFRATRSGLGRRFHRCDAWVMTGTPVPDSGRPGRFAGDLEEMHHPHPETRDHPHHDPQRIRPEPSVDQMTQNRRQAELEAEGGDPGSPAKANGEGRARVGPGHAAFPFDPGPSGETCKAHKPGEVSEIGSDLGVGALPDRVGECQHTHTRTQVNNPPAFLREIFHKAGSDDMLIGLTTSQTSSSLQFRPPVRFQTRGSGIRIDGRSIVCYLKKRSVLHHVRRAG